MVNLFSLVTDTSLCNFTPLKPVLNNVTRCGSTHSMLPRYKNLQEFIAKLEMYDFTLLMRIHYDNVILVKLLQPMRNLESVTKTFRRTNNCRSDPRTLFTGVLDSNQNLLKLLYLNAAVVLHPMFESMLGDLAENRDS